jgi:hypothetical protein
LLRETRLGVTRAAQCDRAETVALLRHDSGRIACRVLVEALECLARAT